MSRPRSSVPSQCSAEGALRIRRKLVFSGIRGGELGGQHRADDEEQHHDGAPDRGAVAQEGGDPAVAGAPRDRGGRERDIGHGLMPRSACAD